MEKIKDLTADQLADFAFNMFILSGRHQKMAQLIYRCIELNPNHPLGLRCLSDFLDWRGSESVSAIILEHIIQNKIPTTEESLKEHKQLLFRSKWVWGFSKHKSDQIHLSMNDFEDESNFNIDDVEYEKFITTAIAASGSRENVLKRAHDLIGLYGQIAYSPSIRENHTIIDFLTLEDFGTTYDYVEFLEESTEILYQIKHSVEQMKNK